MDYDALNVIQWDTLQCSMHQLLWEQKQREAMNHQCDSLLTWITSVTLCVAHGWGEFHCWLQSYLALDRIISMLSSPVVSELLLSHSQPCDDAVPTAVHLYNDDGTSSIAASETIYDPEYHGPDIFPAAAVNDHQVIATLPHFIMQAQFFQLLHERAPDWIKLQSLVDANFKVDIHTIMEVIHHVLYCHCQDHND
ncbi:hypothetical protein EDC04DRAFT_3090180 [Pisolithus marmoratus]|nr:hypothetical protein EDC04DRAFT_3090180 [Pisolithus marmoratus]